MKRRRRILVAIIMIIFLAFTVNKLFFGEEHDSATQAVVSEDMDTVDMDVTDPLVEPTYKVVIDPGHGGSDPGSEGVSGRFEKDFTLELALKVKELLEREAEIQVNLTRSDDTFISSIDRERIQFANDLGADLFISIHGNSYVDDPDVSGTETYYYDEGSIPFATIIHDHVVEATGFRDRGVKQEAYFVLKEANMQAVLIETGFMTNSQEEHKMWDNEVQKQIAISIVEGIKEYLGILTDE